MGRSAGRDTESAVHSVSLLYLDELAGRREQVVADNLSDNINVINIAIDLMTEEDLSDTAHLQAYQTRMKRLFNLEKFAFVDENGLIYTVLGGLAVEDNLLEAMKNAEFDPGYSLEQVVSDFTEGRRGVVSFSYNGVRETLSYVPVEGTDWLLTYLIRESVISEKISSVSNGIIRRSLFQSMLTALVLLMLFSVIIGQTRKSAQIALEKETAEAANRVKRQELEQRLALQEQLLEQERQKAEQGKADLTGRRILVAEDVKVNAEIMVMLLVVRQMTVEVAGNGKIAVDLYESHPAGYYDAILMDVRMPEMDGLEATQIIRASGRDDAKTIPIIALTANAFDEDVQRSLQAGMNAHLTKPVDPENLYETLESMIKA